MRTPKFRAIRWFTGTLPPIGLFMAFTATPWATHRAPPPSSPRWSACPGIPAFLALCFAVFGVANYYAVLYLQAIVDLGTCLLVAGLAAKLCGKRAGQVALLLAALCPFTACYVAAPLTETLSIFCVALGFRALAEVLEGPRPLWTALLIFSWSYAALLRPDGALLAVVLCVALIAYGRRSLGWALRPPPGRGCGPAFAAALCGVDDA